MRKFLKKLFGFSITAIAIVVVLLIFLRSIHEFPPSNMYYNQDLEQAFDEGDIELIALGNSKLLASLDKKTISEGLGMKTAIFGYNSSNISVSMLFLEAYLNHAEVMPKMVLMEVSWFTFNTERTNFHTISGDLLLRDYGMWNKVPRYYPDILKYSMQRAVKQIWNIVDPLQPIDYSSRRKPLSTIEKSYVFEMAEMEKLFPNHLAGIDTFLLEDYQEILNLCLENEIELILYTAPEDEEYSRAQEDISDIKAIYHRNNGPMYLDYSYGGELYDKKYENWLMDSHHVNASELFTEELVHDILERQ